MAENYETHIALDTEATGEGQRLGAEPLSAFFARTPKLAVAFSGGCDSALLLAEAQAAGCEVYAYMVKTAFQPAFEEEDARRVADVLGVPLTVLETDVLAQADICENPPDRCRLCKAFIFGVIRERAAADGYPVLVDGTNATDDPARRPGYRALAEAGVVSPLRRAGLAKADVRAALAAQESARGLEPGALLSAKPSFPCLAIYVPEGEPITQAALDVAARARGLYPSGARLC